MWLEVSHSRVGVDCSVLVEERGGGSGSIYDNIATTYNTLQLYTFMIALALRLSENKKTVINACSLQLTFSLLTY